MMVTSSQHQHDVITDVITHSSDYVTETPAPTETSSDSLWQKVLLGVVMFFIVGVTVVGNGLVLVVVAREKRLRTTFNMMIVNLAFTDFLVGLIAMSFYAAFNIYETWPFGEVRFCRVSECHIVYLSVTVCLFIYKQKLGER